MFQISKLDDSMIYYRLLALGALNWEHLLFKKRAHEVLPGLLKQRPAVRERAVDGRWQNETGTLASVRLRWGRGEARSICAASRSHLSGRRRRQSPCLQRKN